MHSLRVALLIAALVVPLQASAGELALSFKDGRVTLKAKDVSLRQVLAEWARLGHTRIVGIEKVAGGLLTLELTDVPEKQALEVLLRTVSGYVAAPRAGAPATAMSRFDRLLLLPTSVASAATAGGPRPASFAPPPPAAFPDPIQIANQEPDSNNAPAPPGVPVFSPNGDPPNPAMIPGQGRTPGVDDPNAQAPMDGPAPDAPPPIVISRPGVIPLPPAPTPRP